MKYNFKKITIFIVSIFAMFVWTNNVNAITFNRGDSSKNGNVITIPISFDITEGESIVSIKIDCETTNLDVKCEIIKKDTYNEVAFTDAFMKPIGATYFRTGHHDAFIMQITNNSTKEETVTVNLRSSEYATDSGTHKIELSPFETTIPVKASTNPKASDIHFSQGKMIPMFSPDVTEYTVYDIQDTINSVNAFYTCQDKDKCSDSGWSGGKSVSGSKITLNQGENNVSIELISEDGQNRLTYNFKIIRGETTFNSSKLGNIDMGEYVLTPTFSKDINEYSVNVPNKITNVKDIIKFNSEDTSANAVIEGGEGLVVGENIVKIIVDNVNGDASTTYTIKVNRLSSGAIEITNYINNTITFIDAEGVKISLNEDEFKVQYSDEYTKIKNGTYKFNNMGEKITEEITTKVSENTPKKRENGNNKLVLIIVLIAVGLAIIIVSGILIFRRKPQNKGSKKDDLETSDKEETDENGIEEKIIDDQKEANFEDTQDIDEALSDLMSTKQYNLNDLNDFSDEEKE